MSDDLAPASGVVPRRSELYYSTDSSNAAGREDSPVSVAGFLSSNSDSCSSAEPAERWEADEVDPLGIRRGTVADTSTPEKEEEHEEEHEEQGNFGREMVPMTPIFMGDERRAFMRRGRMIYTRAPQQNSKSLLNHPARLKKNKQQNEEETEVVDSNSSSSPGDPNAPGTRISSGDGDHHGENEPGRSMKLNRSELLKLQSQVEELKSKVRDKEGLLQSIKQAAQSDIKMLEEAEMADLRNKVDGLHKELMRRDFLLHSLQHQLSEKHMEMGNMKRLIQGLQNEIVKGNHKHSQMENEMDELRFEVAALRHEHQIAGAPHFVPRPDQMMDDYEGMEEARDKYLAAVLAAKEKPVEEAIAVAAELRQRLRGFVSLSHVFPE